MIRAEWRNQPDHVKRMGPVYNTTRKKKRTPEKVLPKYPRRKDKEPSMRRNKTRIIQN